MKRLLISLLVLAFAIPAVAGMNPHVAIYLYTTSTGVGGTNHKATPAAGSNTSVYVCFDRFGPLGDGVGGGMLLGQFQINKVGGPDFMSVTNLFESVGGLIIGNPHVAPGISMTTGPVAYPSANGVIVLARIRYETPEAGARVGGYLQIIDYSAGDGSVVFDQNSEMDPWCVHSALSSGGVSGNFGWDDETIPDGDCPVISPVSSATWGSIKALYR